MTPSRDLAKLKPLPAILSHDLPVLLSAVSHTKGSIYRNSYYHITSHCQIWYDAGIQSVKAAIKRFNAANFNANLTQFREAFCGVDNDNIHDKMWTGIDQDRMDTVRAYVMYQSGLITSDYGASDNYDDASQSQPLEQEDEIIEEEDPVAAGEPAKTDDKPKRGRGRVVSYQTSTPQDT